MIALCKGKNPIYFGVITIIPFDNLYRRAYSVMYTFLVQLHLYIVVRRSYNLMVRCLLCTRPTRLAGFHSASMLV
jgi:hypothetical protein